MNEPKIHDVLVLATGLASLLFGEDMAELLGPYIVIIAGAVLGSSLALARRERGRRTTAIFFMLRVTGLAILLTVGLAVMLNHMRPEFPVRVLLVPIALLIGYIGDDWPRLLDKIVRAIFSAIDLMRGRGNTP